MPASVIFLRMGANVALSCYRRQSWSALTAASRCACCSGVISPWRPAAPRRLAAPASARRGSTHFISPRPMSVIALMMSAAFIERKL